MAACLTAPCKARQRRHRSAGWLAGWLTHQWAACAALQVPAVAEFLKDPVNLQLVTYSIFALPLTLIFVSLVIMCCRCVRAGAARCQPGRRLRGQRVGVRV